MAEDWRELMQKATIARERSLTAQQQERIEANRKRSEAIQSMTGKPADGITWGKKKSEK